MRTSVDLHVHLLGAGVAHEIIRLDRTAARLEELSDSGEIDAGDLVASRLLTSPRGSALVVTELDAALDLEAIGRATGIVGLRLALPLTAAKITGFPAGWIPPVSLDPSIPTVLDESVAVRDVVYAPAGEPGLVVGMRTADLVSAGALVARAAVPVASMR